MLVKVLDMLLYIFYYNLKNIYHTKKEIMSYQKRNINKLLSKTFQHRAKISLKMKGNKKNVSNKNKIMAQVNKRVMTTFTKKKISIANKGKIKTDEFKKKISLALTGRELSFEHKSKLKDKLSGEKNPRFGKKHTKLSKRKISKTISNKIIKN
nr:CMESO_556 [Cryptomonas curvata]